MQKIKINNDLANTRLDKAISILLTSTSRSKIQDYIDSGLILVNSKQEKASYKLREGDEITIEDFPNEHYDLEAEDIGLAVVKFKNGAIGTVEGTTNVFPKRLYFCNNKTDHNHDKLPLNLGSGLFHT